MLAIITTMLAWMLLVIGVVGLGTAARWRGFGTRSRSGCHGRKT
jgi:hypothetical protein